MATRRLVSQGSFRGPRPTTVSSSSQLEIEEITPASSQVGLQAKKGQLWWTDDIDQVLVDTLLEIVLTGPRRGENRFKADESTPNRAIPNGKFPLEKIFLTKIFCKK